MPAYRVKLERFAVTGMLLPLTRIKTTALTILHLAKRPTGHDALGKLLHRHPELVNVTEPHTMFTPLVAAATVGNATACAMLLRRGATVNHVTADGSTALLRAAGGGHVEAMQALLRGGADVALSNAYGHTPLMLAAMEGAAPCVELLLRAGASVTAVDDSNLTAAAHATRRGHVALLPALAVE